MSFRNQQRGGGRYGTRSSGPDSYSPAYTTQAGYQSNTNQTQPPQPPQQTFKQQVQSGAKQEMEQHQMKGEELNSLANNKPSDDSAMTEDEDKADRPWKKKNFQKLPKKVKKKRLNAKLRNLLAPKNAMMVLHELHPGLSCVTNEEMTKSGQPSYAVIIDIDGKQYKGQGLSKAQAKQTACENALKAALLEKMAQSTLKPHKTELTKHIQSPEAQPMETSDSVEAGSNGDSSPTKPKKLPEEDDVPWGSLASYALFKLFSEWQSQGYSLPTAPGKAQQAQQQQVSNNAIMPMKKMPPDAAQRHPVQLLNQLKPQAKYVESWEGNPPNMTFTYSVSFDDQTFTGVGAKKKDAKKLCAKNALVSLGIQYSE